METTPSSKVEVVDPSDNANFEKGLNELAEKSGKPNPRKYIDEPTDTKKAEEEDAFNSALQYWLSCIGYAVGYGNIWRFPYLLYANGGGAFLVPYLLGLCFIAIPMYTVETSFG